VSSHKHSSSSLCTGVVTPVPNHPFDHLVASRLASLKLPTPRGPSGFAGPRAHYSSPGAAPIQMTRGVPLAI
jgi:hypothetical protein